MRGREMNMPIETPCNSGRMQESGSRLHHPGIQPFSLLFVFLAGLFLWVSCSPSEAVLDRDGVYTLERTAADVEEPAEATARIRSLLERIGDRDARLVIADQQWRVNDVTFPSNVTLEFRTGGTLYVPEEGAIRLEGAIQAGMKEIFPGPGSVTGPVDNLHIYPQWFGARGDGAHDDGPAIQRAADLAVESLGNTLFIPAGEYLFRSDIVLRSNVESRGLLIKEIEIDEERTQFSQVIYVPTHYPVDNPHIYFEPDHEEVELDPEPFHDLKEGDFGVPAYRDLAHADGGGRVDLAEGGTLRFYSTDYFSSRNNQKGDQFYDRRDISQIVSGRGDIFPELAFSYPAPPDAPEWQSEEVYRKGDYVSRDGEVFKATWPSGEGSVYEHPYQGTIRIGSVQPDADQQTTRYEFTYTDGAEDTINIWRRVDMQVWYRQKDRPLTVNGLRMEVRLINHGGQTKRISAGAMHVNRSNMTFNNLEVTVRDREATLGRLVSSNHAVNLEFNNGYFSGATSHGLGYNIRNNYVANVRYNDCISTNSRKGMDGHLSKNVKVNGGFYNVIDDHYSRNFIIRDVVLTGESTNIPGYVTPEADLQAWHFRTIRPIGITGGNLHVENVTIDGGSGGILSVRSDIGDLYGSIVLRDIVVRRNEGDVQLVSHSIDPDFDFVSEVRTPDRMLIENVSLERDGRLMLNLGQGFGGRPYGPVTVRNSGPVGEVYTGSSAMRFIDCRVEDGRFEVETGAQIHFSLCHFSGTTDGAEPDHVGAGFGNTRAEGAEVSFPIE